MRISKKSDIRRQALARRDALTIAERIEISLAIAANHGEIAMTAGEVISGFWPIRSEIDPRPLMFELARRAEGLCLPVIVDGETIIFRKLDRTKPLVESGFGTIGPDAEAPVLDPTLMLVPLAAFDDRGHRIGYGAGYYDRAVARLSDKGRRPRLIGMAFDCQRVDHVPDEAHDVALDGIVTETGLRSFA
jgi:5-formyltetrahydrofolate cyclo-ligase